MTPDYTFYKYFIETTIQFVRRITKDHQIKIANESEITPNIFERHQEAIIADLNCVNTPNIFAKVKLINLNIFIILEQKFQLGQPTYV